MRDIGLWSRSIRPKIRTSKLYKLSPGRKLGVLNRVLMLSTLRKGIHWQNIPPVNGREFTSDDVAYHYHRLYGGGHGFTQRGPGAHYQFTPLESVTVIDKYTVAFKWKAANAEIIRDAMQAWGSLASIEAHEAVEKWGSLDDWHHAIGTGPFILKDFVPGSSATLIKNPNYWGS